MKIFFDTEFIEKQGSIELISIGMVREDGKTLYAENKNCPFESASEWVKENVYPHLTWKNQKTVPEIAKEVKEFCGEKPEFWAYCGGFDWVVFCWLFGRMINIPKGYPFYLNELSMLANIHNFDLSTVNVEGSSHNALDDAIWVKKAYEQISNNSSKNQG